jgi:hypothetical protein
METILGSMLELHRRNLARAAGAAALLAAFAACNDDKAGAASAPKSAAPPPAASPTASVATTPVDGTAELKDFQIFPDRPVKGHQFIGEMVVTKGAAVRDPMFRVLVEDKDGKQIDSGSCAYRGVVKAGDKAPCYGAFWKVATWAKYELVYVRGDSALPAEPSPLSVSDAKLVGADEVDGKITNNGKSTVKKVNAYVSLYGADGKIVGGESAPTSPEDLEPGAMGTFTVKIDAVAAPPKTFAVKTSP